LASNPEILYRVNVASLAKQRDPFWRDYCSGHGLGTPAIESATKPVSTILLVDSDLGFIFWLGRALDNVGFEALPAKSTWDAMALVEDYHLAVDVLIIDPSLPGASRLITLLRQSHRPVQVIAATADPEGLRLGFPQVDVIRRRPHDLDDDSRGDWVRLIQSMLSRRSAGPL
jgi:CheY-like chemotaxis protein